MCVLCRAHTSADHSDRLNHTHDPIRKYAARRGFQAVASLKGKHLMSIDSLTYVLMRANACLIRPCRNPRPPHPTPKSLHKSKLHRDDELKGLLELSADLKRAYTKKGSVRALYSRLTLTCMYLSLSDGMTDFPFLPPPNTQSQNVRPMAGKSISMIFQKRSTRTRCVHVTCLCTLVSKIDRPNSVPPRHLCQSISIV